MSLTTTYLNGAITQGAQSVTLNAYTAPTIAAVQSKPMLKVDSEYMLIVDASNSPTLQVVRGHFGSTAVAHKTSAPVSYGVTGDWPSDPPRNLSTPTVAFNAIDVIATGATGTTAAPITIPAPGLINVNSTGASGAGINLPYPTVGAWYNVKNAMTGVAKIYCIGGTINGTTGTTAYSLTATGSLGADFICTVAGAWQSGEAT